MPILTDTRLASALLGLGFPGTVRPTVIAATRETRVEVHFDAPSPRFPQLDARRLVAQWEDSRFMRPLHLDEHVTLPAQPLHVFAVAMRAQLVYDAYLKAQQEGGSILAAAIFDPAHPGDPIAYEPRYARTALMQRPSLTETLDELRLAAAVFQLGFPPYRILGSPGMHRYELPLQGLPIRDSSGVLIRHSLRPHITWAGDGPKRLLLFDTQPQHPMVIAYDALHARGELAKIIRTARANLLLQSTALSGQQALISLNAPGHVLRQVETHFHAPPGSLDV